MPRAAAPAAWRAQRRAGAWRSAVGAAMLLTGCGVPALVLPHAHAPYHSADPALRGQPLYLYPQRDTTRAARAVVFFFGNDVGFWAVHQRLAEVLRDHGYAVAGFDVRRVLGRLPNGSARESVYLARVDTLLGHARTALGTADRPLVIAGHSIGGELALWTAAHLRAPAFEPGLVGVVSMNPGQRGHVRVALSDMLGREPRERGSFAVDSQVARLVPRVRVALVRGEFDRFRSADRGIVAAGARRFVVAHEHHSLLDITATGPVLLNAVAYVTGVREASDSGPTAAPRSAVRPATSAVSVSAP